MISVYVARPFDSAAWRACIGRRTLMNGVWAGVCVYGRVLTRFCVVGLLHDLTFYG